MAEWFKDSMLADEVGIVMLLGVLCNFGFEFTVVDSE